ncbi:flavodoxin [Mucilaginibacter sp.]
MRSVEAVGLIIMVVFNMLSGCSKAQQTSGGNSSVPSGTGSLAGKKVLIVYLSRTKNTQAIAQMIQKEVSGKLVALELVKPYPQNYQAQVAQVVQENNAGFLPPLKTTIDSMAAYDVIFAGFPTWDMKMPPPMKSFLKQYNLSGKTVIPFNTHAGYGVGSGFQTVKDLCPNSSVLEGFTIKGGIERDGVLFVMEGEKEKQAQGAVKAWLQKLKLVK